MLDLLRRGVKTWVAKILFSLLVVSFAIWGIGDVFSAGLGSSVATVGDQKIAADRYASALNREIRSQSQRFGQPIDSDMARAMGLPNQVLARMAQEATLDEAIAQLELSAPDDAVAEIVAADPSFQGASGFDPDTYRYVLAQADFTVEEYEEAIRRSVVRAELARALSVGGAAPSGAVDAIFEFQTEARRVDFITLSAATHAEDPGAPTEAELTAHHEANTEIFTAPEMRDVVWIHLDLATLGADHEPDDSELRALYDLRASDYIQPERRALYQIVYDDEATAAEAVASVAAGDATFDDLLAARGESRSDASLGEVAEGEVLSAAGDVAFALSAPGVAGPADTGFGFAVIDVAAITPAETTSFEDARAELVADLRREAALDLAPERAGEIEDLRAGGSTLEEVARQLGLPLGSAEDVTAAGADGLLGRPEFIAALFDAETGEELDLVEMADGSWFVLRVEDVTPPALRPLEEVRELVEASWRAETVQASLMARAEALQARIDTGETLESVAEELAVEIESEGPKTRAAGWAAITPDAVEALFAAEDGDPFAAPTPGRGDSTVVGVVAEIAKGASTPENQALRGQLAAQMNAMAGDDALTLFLGAKQREVGVTVNQQLIDSLLSTQGAM